MEINPNSLIEILLEMGAKISKNTRGELEAEFTKSIRTETDDKYLHLFVEDSSVNIIEYGYRMINREPYIIRLYQIPDLGGIIKQIIAIGATFKIDESDIIIAELLNGTEIKEKRTIGENERLTTKQLSNNHYFQKGNNVVDPAEHNYIIKKISNYQIILVPNY